MATKLTAPTVTAAPSPTSSGRKPSVRIAPNLVPAQRAVVDTDLVDRTLEVLPEDAVPLVL